MLNGELTPRSNLIGELTGGVFYGTNDYEELINKPSINGVELKGNKTTSDLGINIPTELSELTNDVGFITSADVPTKTSDLTNDSGYITSADVSAVAISGDYDDLTNKPTIPTLTSQLTNDSGFITNASVPTMTSQLFNDSGFITSADIPTDVSAFTNDAGYITSADIPTDVSAFTNDAGYITSADIPTDVSAFNNDAGYISNSDLMTATASGSIATFDNGGDDIPVSEFECEIVAQQGSGTPSPLSPLPITGFSQADIPVSGKNLWNEQWELGTLNWTTGQPEPSNDTIRAKNYISVKPNTSYFINVGVKGVTLYEYDINKSFIQRTLNTSTNATITTTANTRYVRFRTFNNATTYDNDISINYPSTDTQYHAYTGNLYTVAFGQTIYGGRLIYANGQWSIEATHGEYTFDGTETPIAYGSGYRYVVLTGKKGKSYGQYDIPDAISNQYVAISRNDIQGGSTGFSLTGDTILLSTDTPTGIQICYELETPVIIPITSSTRVKTISGDNNIYSSTGDCELKYFTNKADSLAELIKAFVL